ncbi:MAG: flavodoxin-dependent (E)-4-hydroxy-3-methylbut-2-enyl-diphosphate synthase [Clostridiales bacterium]|nr:flavodoxin-dependent (E)-4-hydroxy-3-methylbut-2-enyl-diphosphate synthase [Clostridiales bacterium]
MENIFGRKGTRVIDVGGVKIGGDNKIAVQSMNNTLTSDIEATLRQIDELKDAGCDITRVAIPDKEAAEALKEITKRSSLPVVADIHFDYRLALMAVENGASKIRINPGNIGGRENVLKVANACKERSIPIRVGVNSGSIEKSLIEKYGKVCPEAMTESALGAVKLLEDVDFDNIIISIKSSSPRLTIETYRELSKLTDHPLHVGVTEAGTVREGIIKSAVGIGSLLSSGIGDTIRVSLTGDPVDEVLAGIGILKALDLRKGGITFVSCPTCGRTKVPLIELASEIEKRICGLPYDLKVAVMGCAVNGPGEARDADIGLAGAINEFILFEKGETIRRIKASDAVEEFVAEVIKLGEMKNGR